MNTWVNASAIHNKDYEGNAENIFFTRQLITTTSQYLRDCHPGESTATHIPDVVVLIDRFPDVVFLQLWSPLKAFLKRCKRTEFLSADTVDSG